PRQPRRHAGPDPVLAGRTALPDDRGEGPRRPPAGQPEALAGLLRRARHAGGRLLRALEPVRVSYAVAVRALCEFTAKEGDLDLRFTPAPSASEGMAGHATVVGRRAPGYLAELPLAGEYPGLLVSGRADGYDPGQNLLEEIKTHRGDVARIPDNHRLLHWA